MKQLQPVLWTKGTFLTPQHLQLQDRFLEDSLNFRLQALKFCAWGFSEVVLDQEQLADGHLAVSRASGIFPDGLLFDIPGSDQPPPSKALAEFFDPGVHDLDIYLTVPDYRQKGLNVSPVGRSAGSRYLAEITSMVDENTGTERSRFRSRARTCACWRPMRLAKEAPPCASPTSNAPMPAYSA